MRTGERPKRNSSNAGISFGRRAKIARSASRYPSRSGRCSSAIIAACSRGRPASHLCKTAIQSLWSTRPRRPRTTQPCASGRILKMRRDVFVRANSSHKRGPQRRANAQVDILPTTASSTRSFCSTTEARPESRIRSRYWTRYSLLTESELSMLPAWLLGAHGDYLAAIIMPENVHGFPALPWPWLRDRLDLGPRPRLESES